MGIKLYNYPTNLNCTVLLQKNVVLLFPKKPHYFAVHTDPAFKEFLKFLKFSKNYLLQIGKFAHFHNIGILPEIVNEICSVCSVNNKVHSYVTRNSNAIYLFPA